MTSPVEKNSEIRKTLPLSGQMVLITRPREQSQILEDLLADAGATVLNHPVIEILPLENGEIVAAVIRRIDQFGWLVFASSNGVDHFFQCCQELELTNQHLRHLKIAAIGSRTADQLKQVGCHVDLIPAKSNSCGLAESLIASQPTGPVLVVRANRGSPELSQRLQAAGIQCEQIEVYRSRDVRQPDFEIVRQLDLKKIDWVTLTSSAIACSTVNLFGESLRNTRLATISPATTAALLTCGFAATAEATLYNMQGIVAAIVRHGEFKC